MSPCISLRITRVIHIAAPELPPIRRSCSSLQLVCGAVRRFRENCFHLFEDMHGLVFRRSIHYWQDQPGNQGGGRGAPRLANPSAPPPPVSPPPYGGYLFFNWTPAILLPFTLHAAPEGACIQLERQASGKQAWLRTRPSSPPLCSSGGEQGGLE